MTLGHRLTERHESRHVANFCFQDARFLRLWELWHRSLRQQNPTIRVEILMDRERPRLRPWLKNDTYLMFVSSSGRHPYVPIQTRKV